MAQLTPVRALTPDPSVASRVSSVPYDVVSTEEAAALADGEALSFLRVTRSELELPPGTDPYADEVYQRARQNFAQLKRQAPLHTDASANLYVYRLRMGDHTQTGVAGGYSIDEYEAGRIKRHEKTRRAKEDDRTRHIVTLRAQTGVVLLTYRADSTIDATVGRVVNAPPHYDFVASDGVLHQIWRVNDADREALIAGFSSVPSLYIADGHHRAASAARARAQLQSSGGPGGGALDTFLAVAFPDEQLQVLPYHRVVRDLSGRSPEEFLAVLGARFAVQEGLTEGPGAVGFHLGDRWRSLRLQPNTQDSVADSLDAEMLSRQVLGPLLGIEDLRTDTRVDFVGGIRGLDELERRVRAGDAAVAFALRPVQVEDLLRVSDADQIMPPKSTWFEPKLRDGLLIQEI